MSTLRLLPFQQHILTELTTPGPESDGLLLLARGLGIRSILCALLESYTADNEANGGPDGEGGKTLVVVVNADPDEERGLAEELGMKLTIVGFEMTSKDRETCYARGGVVSITTRILIIDMLLERIPVAELTGLVVLHAERVNPTSMEAFVMRVYREKNKHGFIKAFSDEPETFTYGVSPLQTVLTQLHIRHVFLYPRFHERINTDLARQTDDVINFHQPLSEKMDTIQTSIIECMDATLAELKRSNTIIDVEETLTVQNALFRSFDSVIKAQLDPQWHKIGPKTRQLVHDLTTLRQLLVYLLTLDAVSFNQHIETILASNTTNFLSGQKKTNQSPWLFLPAADTIFSTAQARVYKKVAVQAEASKTKEASADVAARSSEAAEKEKARPPRAETEDPYSLNEDDSIFDDPALLEATLSAPKSLPANGGSTEDSSIPGTPADTVSGKEHSIDLTADDGDVAAETSGNDQNGGNGVVGVALDENGTSISATLGNGKEPWAYWCPPGSIPVLEEQPKWHLLREILEEIENKIHWAPAYVHDENPSNNSILIMCSTPGTCTILRKYLSSLPDLSYRISDDTDIQREEYGKEALSSQGREFMLARSTEYFYWKAALGKMSKNVRALIGPSNPSGAGDINWAAVNASRSGKYGDRSNTSSDKNKNTVSNYNRDVNYESAALKRKQAYKHGQPINKRRRVRGGGAVGSSETTRGNRDKDGDKLPGGHSGAAFETETEALADSLTAGGSGTGLLPASLQDPEEDFDPVAFNEFFGLCSAEDTVVMRPYSGDEDDRVLDELRPRYIVMFDPDPSFVRRIETYRAAHPGLRLQTYFMLYSNSAEEQKYLSQIRRERESFERLIKERSSMAIPLQAERNRDESRADDYLRTISSRQAGGGRFARADPPKVIVDVREFRSSLPSLLHAAGFIVVPVTLTIGDYVLSPDLVVERKSLPDLIQSFNSGRLYQQCEVMSTHYKIPLLLIEFDQKKSFSLETYSDPRGGPASSISDNDLHSKLVLLTLTFPRLRIIWSSSPYATADIFADLKTQRDEPDVTTAAAVGMEEGEQGQGESEAAVNQTPQEILRNLPGITTKNYRYVMQKVANMEELGALSLEELNKIIGVEAGRQLHTFLNYDLAKKKSMTRNGKSKNSNNGSAGGPAGGAGLESGQRALDFISEPTAGRGEPQEEVGDGEMLDLDGELEVD